MREFAEQEIVIPDGPFAGQKFSTTVQPFAGVVLDAIEHGGYRRVFGTGCVQSGKTLLLCGIPVCFYLFELGVNVVYGIPTLDIVRDKWHEDILPVIACTQYAEHLPKIGAGSRGGVGVSVRFRNGATLRFMTGHGGDEGRSGFTAPAVLATEVDKFAQPGVGGVETDKLRQIEARNRAYALTTTQRMIGECTVTVEDGRIWQEIKGGTDSRIVTPCPHCNAYVLPEREHLVGWQDCDNELDAGERVSFCCPACGVLLSEADRRTSNTAAVLLHDGQKISDTGNVAGEAKRTKTLGLRWSAWHNMLIPASYLGEAEWRARASAERLGIDRDEEAEKDLCQLLWATPYESTDIDLSGLTPALLEKRISAVDYGVVPADTERLTIGVDLAKWSMWHVVVAWQSGGRSQIVEYGEENLNTDDLGVERATLTRLREFRDRCQAGFPCGNKRRVPDAVWIDCGYSDSREAVYQFCRESQETTALAARYRPCRGYGASNPQGKRGYTHPSRKGNTYAVIGEEYHLLRVQTKRVIEARINADHWKSFAHERLRLKMDAGGSMRIPKSPDRDRKRYKKLIAHLTAERRVQKDDPKKGRIQVWERLPGRRNDWLDCLYYACAAGHFAGWRLVKEAVAKPPPQTKRPVLTMPDGRPFLITERQAI